MLLSNSLAIMDRGEPQSLGREALYKISQRVCAFACATNTLSNRHLVFGPYFSGTLVVMVVGGWWAQRSGHL